MSEQQQPGLRHIPLHALHAAHGAKFGAFAGYEMPIQYPQGLRAEHLHTRDRAGLFDVSHMGQLRIRAADDRPATLYAQLEAALPVDFDGWADGVQRYSLLLNERGGIDDDLMLVHGVDGARAEVRMVVNAGNRDADLALLRARCPKLRIEWVDAALVALQGPAAEAALAAPVRRRRLASPAVRRAGLGARDTPRLEAGPPLHGSDIDAGTTPVESGLAFAIPRSRRAGGAKAGGFPGAATILAQLAEGTPRRLVGLVSHEQVPVRAHAVIVSPDDRAVGEVTSATVSPTLGHPVMLARVERGALDDATRAPLRAVVRDRRPGVMPTPLPFVPKRYKR